MPPAPEAPPLLLPILWEPLVHSAGPHGPGEGALQLEAVAAAEKLPAWGTAGPSVGHQQQQPPCGAAGQVDPPGHIAASSPPAASATAAPCRPPPLQPAHTPGCFFKLALVYHGARPTSNELAARGLPGQGEPAQPCARQHSGVEAAGRSAPQGAWPIIPGQSEGGAGEGSMQQPGGRGLLEQLAALMAQQAVLAEAGRLGGCREAAEVRGGARV